MNQPNGFPMIPLHRCGGANDNSGRKLREEIDRAQRYHRAFTLLVFEAVPGDGVSVRQKVAFGEGALASILRVADVIARVLEDTIVVLLVETDAAGARDVFFRIRNRVSYHAGRWEISMASYPGDEELIESLPFLNAA